MSYRIDPYLVSIGCCCGVCSFWTSLAIFSETLIKLSSFLEKYFAISRWFPFKADAFSPGRPNIAESLGTIICKVRKVNMLKKRPQQYSFLRFRNMISSPTTLNDHEMHCLFLWWFRCLNEVDRQRFSGRRKSWASYSRDLRDQIHDEVSQERWLLLYFERYWYIDGYCLHW